MPDGRAKYNSMVRPKKNVSEERCPIKNLIFNTSGWHHLMVPAWFPVIFWVSRDRTVNATLYILMMNGLGTFLFTLIKNWNEKLGHCFKTAHFWHIRYLISLPVNANRNSIYTEIISVFNIKCTILNKKDSFAESKRSAK